MPRRAEDNFTRFMRQAGQGREDSRLLRWLYGQGRPAEPAPRAPAADGSTGATVASTAPPAGTASKPL